MKVEIFHLITKLVLLSKLQRKYAGLRSLKHPFGPFVAHGWDHPVPRREPPAARRRVRRARVHPAQHPAQSRGEARAESATAAKLSGPTMASKNPKDFFGSLSIAQPKDVRCNPHKLPEYVWGGGRQHKRPLGGPHGKASPKVTYPFPEKLVIGSSLAIRGR